MGFVHRKLMGEPPFAPAPAPVVQLVNATAAVLSPDSFNATLNAVCSPFCNPLINSSGYCLSLCLPLCPANCRFPIPPPDDDAFSDYSPPPPFVAGKHHLSPLLVTTFVALSLAVLIVIGYIVYVKRCGQRRNRGDRRTRAQLQRAVPPQDDEFLDDLGPVLDHPIWYIHTVGLQPSVISKIAVCTYNKGDGLIEGTECSVCLTEFEEDETVRLLPKCSHAFHVPCIDTWLRSHTNCPNCRAPIVTSTSMSPSPEQSGSWENVRLDEGGNDVELGRESTDDVPHQSGGESEELTELGRPQGVVDESGNGIQPIRRSVSVDSLSAAKINALVAELLIGKSMRNSDPESGDLENQLDHKNKGVADSSSSSIDRSSRFLSEPSTSMKRSLSWSGRLFVAKYSRSRGSVFPQYI